MPLTGWTASNDATTATVAPLSVLDTAKSLQHVDCTHPASKKSWCKTQATSKQSTQKHKQPVLAAVLVDESENTFTHEPMNSEFVCSTEGGMFDANHQPKATRC